MNLSDWFQGWIEIGRWGSNWETFFFVGTLVTFVYGCYGIVSQGRTIGRNSSGRTVSAAMLIYGSLFFLSCGVWGLLMLGIGLMTGFVRGALQIWVLARLYRHKGFSKTDWTLVAFCVVAFVLLIFLPDSGLTLFGTEKPFREWLFLFIGLGTCLSFLPQIFELVRERDPGSLNLHILLSAFLGILLWTGYSVCFAIWPLIISNSVMLALVGTAIALWTYFYFRKKYGP